MSPVLRAEDGYFCAWPVLPWLKLWLHAIELRRERTGLHAQIILTADQPDKNSAPRTLAYDTFNVGRSEDRSRLSRQAYAVLEHVDYLAWSALTPVVLQYALDRFCAQLPALYLERWQVQDVTPAEHVVPPQWWVYPYVLRAAGTILYGPPESGKSWLLYLLAQCLNQGAGPIWPVAGRAKVAVINLERSGESLANWRLAGVNRALGLPLTTSLPVLTAPGESLSVLAPALRALKPDVLLLDSLSRAGMGSLIEDQPAMSTIDMLNRTCRTWLALGHTPRASKDHLFGSIHYEAGADIMVQCLSQDTSLGIGQLLRVTKANDFRKPRPESLHWEFDGDTLVRVRRVNLSTLPELEAETAQKQSPLQRVRDAVLSMGRATATQLAEATGLDRGFVSALLRGRQFVRLERAGKEVYYGIHEGNV